ncbi:MAG: hypothetical protein DI527_21115 [Chelatococcus sp.]|nr:MAG: hypothetical protein DI527_21115 [Chelatococcus sp.]
MAVELSGAVGRGSAGNAPRDVGLVQAFFTAYLAHIRDPQLAIAAGWTAMVYDPSLGDIIAWFQTRRRLPVVDGRIDRGGRTWREILTVIRTTPQLVIPGWVDPQPGPTQDFVKRTDRSSGFQDTAQSLPQLLFPSRLSTHWEMEWGAATDAPVDFWYYECPSSARCQFIGVAAPANLVDADALLIFFHHPIHQEPGKYDSRQSYLDWGIGDYMIGRMQVMRQLALSGKRVAVVVPAPVQGGRTEFTSDESFVRRALARIDSDMLGIETDDFPDLILAGYSGGLKDLDDFYNNMPTLRSKVRAVIDFDGALVGPLAKINLRNWATLGAQVLRYKGSASPLPGPKDDKGAFLNRVMTGNPRTIPLAFERWARHDNIWQAKAMQPTWWMHHYIPTCMLQHALVSCSFLK